MQPAAASWIQVSEAAFATAVREHGADDSPNPAAVCHAAHRCALSLLRARLAEGEVPYPDTLHPVVLLECCLELEPDWEDLRDPLRALHVNALDTELAEHALDETRAQTSLEACELVRARITARMA